MSKPINIIISGDDNDAQQTVLGYLATSLHPLLRDTLKQSVQVVTIKTAEMTNEDIVVARRKIQRREMDPPSFGTSPAFVDDAHVVAEAVLENIRGRSGIGNELEAIDEDTQQEMVESISGLIRVGMKAVG